MSVTVFDWIAGRAPAWRAARDKPANSTRKCMLERPVARMCCRRHRRRRRHCICRRRNRGDGAGRSCSAVSAAAPRAESRSAGMRSVTDGGGRRAPRQARSRGGGGRASAPARRAGAAAAAIGQFKPLRARRARRAGAPEWNRSMHWPGHRPRSSPWRRRAPRKFDARAKVFQVFGFEPEMCAHHVRGVRCCRSPRRYTHDVICGAARAPCMM